MTTNGSTAHRDSSISFSDLYIYLDAVQANHFSGLTEDHFLSQVYSFFLSFLSLFRHGRCSFNEDFSGLTEDHFLSQIKGQDGTS